MEKLEVHFKVTTPLFMGGADSKKAELAASGIKGALRFWWRALAYSEHAGNISRIQEQETGLFGSTKRQSKIVILPPCYPQRPQQSQKINTYLGYGITNREGIANRESFPAGKDLVLRLISYVPEDDTVVRAIKALGFFGGLGSRARRGFGSLSLKRILKDGKLMWESPDTIEMFQKDVHELLKGNMGEDMPSYSAFSRHTRVYLLKSDDDAMTLLNMIGRELQLYRSWGRDGYVGSERGGRRDRAEKNFEDDHDLMYSVVNRQTVTGHPRRVVFGLPHPYYFSGGGKAQVNASKDLRRSSPLFLHIHEIENRYLALATILTAEFLPQDMKLTIGNTSVPHNVDYSVLYQFAEGNRGGGEGTRRFPHGRLLWP